MTASIGPISTLIGVSICWLPFNILPGGDLAHKVTVRRSKFLLMIYMNIIRYSFYLDFYFHLLLFLRDGNYETK